MYDLIEMLYHFNTTHCKKDCKFCKYYDVCKIILDFPRSSIKHIAEVDNHFYSIHYAEGE